MHVRKFNELEQNYNLTRYIILDFHQPENARRYCCPIKIAAAVKDKMLPTGFNDDLSDLIVTNEFYRRGPMLAKEMD